MKKVFLLATRLWTKNKFSNIMIIILAFITFFLFSTLYNKYRGFYETSDYFSSTPLSSSVVFMGREPAFSPEFGVVTDPQYIKEFVNKAKKSGIVSSLSGMYDTIVTQKNGENVSIRVYDKTTASFIKNLITIKGKWLFEEEISEYYPVVVRNGKNTSWKIGDIFPLELELRSKTSLTTDTEGDQLATTHNVQCIVVGVATDKTQTAFFLGQIKSNYTDTVENTFFCFPVPPERALIYFPNDGKLFNDYVYTSDTVIAYFNDNATDEQIANFYAQSCELGYSEMGTDIIAASKAEGDFQFHKNFFVFYSLIILTFVSIFCISFLNIKKISKSFAVYYLNGCTKLKSVVVYFLYFILLYTLPLILYIIVTQIIYMVLANSSNIVDFIKSAMYKIDIRVPIIAWFIGILISSLASIAPFASMKGKTIINNLRED